MGNCLVLQGKIIKVVKTDGKLLEYKSPIRVHQVLSDFAGHALSDTLSAACHLRPDSVLVGGRLYHLLPLPVIPPPPAVEKKRVRFANPEVLESSTSTGELERGVVRIKVVISKQELEMMLRKGGIVSVDDFVSQLHHHKEENKNQNDHEFDDDGGNYHNIGRSSEGWKPMLESISELS